MEREGNYIFIEECGITTPNLVHIPEFYEPYVSSVLVPKGLIKDRIQKLAQLIETEYRGKHILMLVVLRGAFRFAKDLIQHIDKMPKQESSQYSLEFIRARSYRNEEQHEIELEGIDNLTIENKDILILEDLVDSGRTLQKIKEKLLLANPRSLRIACLAYKRNPLNTFIVPEYIGFSLPDQWIIGYHIDYNDYFRDISHICVLNDQGKDRFKVNQSELI